MSVESAKAFIEIIQTDEEFSKKVKQCKNAEERMAFVKKAGFDFTAEEIRKMGEQQLSDGELDVVVGGNSSGCENMFCSALEW